MEDNPFVDDEVHGSDEGGSSDLCGSDSPAQNERKQMEDSGIYCSAEQHSNHAGGECFSCDLEAAKVQWY